MITEKIRTEFAPPERASDDDIKSDANKIDDIPMIHDFMDLLPDVFLILNKERQIVYSNKTLFKTLGIDDTTNIYGLRPGEALDCIHAKDNNSGCGTSAFCRYCGAVNAILKSQNNYDNIVIEECRITSGDEETPLDFRVWAKTIKLEEKAYTMFVVRDISNEKRRSALEKTFFHDILNTAGGLNRISSLLNGTNGEDLDELIQLVESASNTLVDEIKAQKDILAAESGNLKLEMTSLASDEILFSVLDIYKKHEVSDDKEIVVSPDTAPLDFNSDARILKRIIGNMLKNALEATPAGGKVTLGARQDGNNVEFWVKNDTVMSEEVKMQFFQRSFSTKGTGRGIGTYSVKMFGEKYLNGKVSFSSEEGEGTVVSITLPLEK